MTSLERNPDLEQSVFNNTWYWVWHCHLCDYTAVHGPQELVLEDKLSHLKAHSTDAQIDSVGGIRSQRVDTI